VATAQERQRLVDENVSFVRASAAKLKESLPREIDFDDLVQYGMAGLLEAAERYDRKHGVAFTTFAWYRVRGAMFDGLRQMGYTKREDAMLRFEERATAYLGNVADRAASAGHVEVELEDDVRTLADVLAGIASIYSAVDATSEPATPEEELETRERSATIARALGTLPEKERRLLELYYVEDRSLLEAGQMLNLSKSWASRLHARAIELLKEALAGSEHAPEHPPPRTRLRARRT
jgi:RNA polymerase sigma factor for flagellar operon FliA